MNTRNLNVRSKIGTSENLTLKALSLALHDNFPNLNLEFVEHNEKTNQSYPVDLSFTEVKYIDNERIVMHGNLTVSLRSFGFGAIEYNFNTQDFYRVSYSDKTTRSRKLHTLIPHNEETINNMLAFISNYLCSREDYETDVTCIDGSKVFIENREVKTILSEKNQEIGYMSVEDGRKITLEAIAKTFK